MRNLPKFAMQPRAAVASIVSFLLLCVVPFLWAIPFSKAKIIIEVNASAGDAGIQISVDGSEWNRLEVFDPNGRRIFEGTGRNSVGTQGVTEFFFESAEPSFDDLPLAELFLRFPEGIYKFAGVTVDGKTLTGKAGFTHAIPDGPEIVSPPGGATVDSIQPVVIAWEPVMRPFPGTTKPVKITGYQVIVERVKPQPLLAFSSEMPATATQVTVPAEFLQGKAEYNVEVLAIEAGGNQTITERAFKAQ